MTQPPDSNPIASSSPQVSETPCRCLRDDFGIIAMVNECRIHGIGQSIGDAMRAGLEPPVDLALPQEPRLDARMRGSISDYHVAPSGEGPLAPEWQDKPHRLLYDLLGEIQTLRAASLPASPAPPQVTVREWHDGEPWPDGFAHWWICRKCHRAYASPTTGKPPAHCVCLDQHLVLVTEQPIAASPAPQESREALPWSECREVCGACGRALAYVDQRCEQSVLLCRAADREPTCARCGGPHRFDISIPSEIWNPVIRPCGEVPDLLCGSCIIAAFVKAGVGFSGTLWGAGFHGESFTLTIGGTNG